MAQIKVRRMADAARQAITPALGEPVWATDTEKLWVGNGVTAGGIATSSSDVASIATKLATARTISLTGDVTGSISFDGSTNVSLSAVVSDSSHNHATSTITGLDSALSLKAALASPALTGTPTAPTPTAGNSTTQIATTAFVATTVANAQASGGTVIVDNLTSTSSTSALSAAQGKALNTAISSKADAIHTHTIANVSGLQTALDSKASTSSADFTSITVPTIGQAIAGSTYAASTAYVQTRAEMAESYAKVPAGVVIYHAKSTAPNGYLKCNGALISRSTYANLFSAIGTTFGSGDGSTTFALPDLRGEFIRGFDDGRGADSGRSFASTQSSQNLSHTHQFNNETSNSTHTLGFGRTDISPEVVNDGSGYTVGSNGNDRLISIVASGGNESRPRNVALLACIKY